MIPLWFPNAVRVLQGKPCTPHENSAAPYLCFNFLKTHGGNAAGVRLALPLLFRRPHQTLQAVLDHLVSATAQQQQQQRGQKSKNEWRRQETPQSGEFIPCDACITAPPSDSALFIHVWQSAGSWLEGLKGIQLRQEFTS